MNHRFQQIAYIILINNQPKIGAYRNSLKYVTILQSMVLHPDMDQ
jgi:hypothetical protein